MPPPPSGFLSAEQLIHPPPHPHCELASGVCMYCLLLGDIPRLGAAFLLHPAYKSPSVEERFKRRGDAQGYAQLLVSVLVNFTPASFLILKHLIVQTATFM
jgi:hypothetical protein